MAFEKQHIIDQMQATGIVPLFTHDGAGVAREVLAAVHEAGVKVFEFTNRRKNSFDVFCELQQHRSQFPELMIGIGTVMDAETAERFIDAGADFIISPIMKPEMATVCHRFNRLWIPGCATLTEIVTARDHGAEVMKVFPGSVLGPSFVASIMPVVPDLRLMITGGVEPNERNLSAWFGAGAMCVGMGSQLFTREILETRDWKTLRQRVADSLAIVKKIRAN